LPSHGKLFSMSATSTANPVMRSTPFSGTDASYCPLMPSSYSQERNYCD
jgi:hypothetical protein